MREPDTRRLLLFSKVPRADVVKTRLGPALDGPARVAISRAFLADQLDFVGGFERTRAELWLRGAWTPADLAHLPLASVRLASQTGDDLGARMLHALRDGGGPAVVVAADSPTLPAGLVAEAFDALDDGADVAAAPADDGGYVLIGVRGRGPSPAPLFRGMPWGGPDVLERTRRAAATAGLRLHLTAPWYDVDDPAALDRLRAELTTARGRARAPRTAALLLDGPGNAVV